MKWLNKLINATSGNEPIVLSSQICRSINDKILTLPGGQRIFPFNQLAIRFHLTDREEESLIRAAFGDGTKLERYLQDNLKRQDVSEWKELRVRIEFTTEAAILNRNEKFSIVYLNDDIRLPRAILTIIRGRTMQPEYILKKNNRIGRSEEVSGRYGNLIWRNDIIFVDAEDEVNLSVGRIQSRIEYDPTKRRFLLYDENSRHGTSIERDGRVLTISGRRGVVLSTGDTIHFGLARCRYEER